MKILSCEQVSDGHPDKICDQISDAIVTECLQHDPGSRVAIECLLKDNHLIIAGELTSTHEPDYQKCIGRVFDSIGKDRLGYTPELDTQILVKKQSPDIAIGVDGGGAGDQGVMYGYATNETPEMMPIPFVLATKFLQKLKAYNPPMLKADAKSQVSYDYDNDEITAFLCSVQHSPDVEIGEFQPLLRELMIETAEECNLNTDFKKLVNPTGRFTIGGSYADCGVTGRKICCDSYGSVAHVGGGAFSGKDPSKVDRSAAYMLRQIARDIVHAGFAEKCEIQVAYSIGVPEPVSVNVECFGTNHRSHEFIERIIREGYYLTPQAISKFLRLTDVDYLKACTYGHFGKQGLPWEM